MFSAQDGHPSGVFYTRYFHLWMVAGGIVTEGYLVSSWCLDLTPPRPVSLEDLTEWHVNSSALALVDGEPWPMHQPLSHSCSLSLLHFKMEEPHDVNKVSTSSLSQNSETANTG